MHETPFTANAVELLKPMLFSLGKTAYEAAIKIIADVGSRGGEEAARAVGIACDRGG